MRAEAERARAAASDTAGGGRAREGACRVPAVVLRRPAHGTVHSAARFLMTWVWDFVLGARAATHATACNNEHRVRLIRHGLGLFFFNV